MIEASLPLNETARLQELHACSILDTPAEQDYNHLVELAALICDCPMSVINFIDADRQWGKAMLGLGDTTAPRNISMCAHTILQNDVMVVEDTLQDQRFFDNPFTTEGGVRFYAGVAICTDNGFNLGTICVCDTRPNALNKRQLEALKRLARQAAVLLEVRRQNKKLEAFAHTERALKEEAVVARKAQEQFLSTMSHEIRTPLNGIIGMVQILQSEGPRPEQLPYLDTLRFASGNLLHIVNDILDYNKISSGKISLELIPFDLHGLLHDIHGSHAPMAVEKGITFSLNIEQGTPQIVEADPTRLTQVLNNLIGNAIKFTLKGGVTVHIRTISRTAGSVRLLFSVSDTGIGFDEQQAGIIFEEFLQADRTTTRRFGGTGLGLSITKQLVELMGSGIKVTSQPNKGSCFQFELELQIPEHHAAHTHTPDTPAQQRELAHLNILVVEDNAVNMMVTRKMLQKKGARIDAASNGKEALQMLATTAYDVVLLDVHMPVMDGVSALKKMRKEKIYSGPVILLTADVFIDNTEELAEADYSDYLSKPFCAEDLYRKIFNAVQSIA